MTMGSRDSQIGIQYDDGRTEEGDWRFLAASMHRTVYRSVGSTMVFKLHLAPADMGELANWVRTRTSTNYCYRVMHGRNYPQRVAEGFV